jgi:Mn2+/Fe2+ NRAMP family transporter
LEELFEGVFHIDIEVPQQWVRNERQVPRRKVVLKCIGERRTGVEYIFDSKQHGHANWLLQTVVALLFVANTFNIGADLGAMAAASRLLLPAVPTGAYLLLFSLICMAGQILLHHTRYVAVLKWLTLSLFAYFAVLCVVHMPWLELLKGLLWPRLAPDRDFWLTVVAILGTTISPYLFFWQAAQEVEDTKAEPVREPLRRRPSQGPDALARIQLDTIVGMGISKRYANPGVNRWTRTLRCRV